MSWTEIMIAIKRGIVASAESVANIVSGATKVGNADKLDGFDSTNFMYRSSGYGSNVFGSYDLNVWIKPGCYSCETNCINTPADTDSWGDLLVFGGIGDRITQIFRPWNKSSSLYFRSLNSATWAEWLNLTNAHTVDGLHADAFLKTTGGILTGSLQMGSGILQARHINGYGDDGTNNLYLNYSHPNNDVIISSNGAQGSALHTGISAKVIVSTTAPADTTAVWIVPN